MAGARDGSWSDAIARRAAASSTAVASGPLAISGSLRRTWKANAGQPLAYERSKLDGERRVLEFAERTSCPVVVIRPPASSAQAAPARSRWPAASEPDGSSTSALGIHCATPFILMTCWQPLIQRRSVRCLSWLGDLALEAGFGLVRWQPPFSRRSLKCFYRELGLSHGQDPPHAWL